MVSIKAHFDGEAIIPDEPVDLPRGRALVVDIREAESEHPDQPDGEESVFAWIAQHAISSPNLPPDLAHQHDHYLYGTPKKPT